MSLIYTLPRLFVGSFTLVLPFFPTGTMERVDKEGQVATAYTMARIVSHIPLSRGGPTSLVTYDIHALQVCMHACMPTRLWLPLMLCMLALPDHANPLPVACMRALPGHHLTMRTLYRLHACVSLQERFYFGDSVLPLFLSGVPLLKDRLRLLDDFDNITIAFPDEGAHKRFHEMFSDFPSKDIKPIICTKVRQVQSLYCTVLHITPYSYILHCTCTVLLPYRT